VKIHKVVSVSNERTIREGRCFRCGAPIRGRGRTAEVIIKEKKRKVRFFVPFKSRINPSQTHFTRHVPLHLSCSPPREGERVEWLDGFVSEEAWKKRRKG